MADDKVWNKMNVSLFETTFIIIDHSDPVLG